MARKGKNWRLEDLIDFEQALATMRTEPDDLPPPSAIERSAVCQAIENKQAAEARRTGLLAWLKIKPRNRNVPGRRFLAALSLVGGLLGMLAWLSGISAVLGLLDRTRGGINVTLFVAILLGGQWIILTLSVLAWLFRRKAGEGFSGLQALIGKLALRFSGSETFSWWRGVMDGGNAPRSALLWRLARLAQSAGMLFNMGVVCGLLGLVLVKHVGFFWETTTDDAMRHGLETTTRLMASPWSDIWRDAVPSPEVIQASRWDSGRIATLPAGPSEWWKFLLMAMLVWGFFPRALLWLLAWHGERRALASLDFQARHHRALWRTLTHEDRQEADKKPLDGVLVLDVGGSGLPADALRPFLLRRLRVNPTCWLTIAVMDENKEAEAEKALAAAPAGIVLLAEGWALSPARMTALHEKIRAWAGANTPLKFLIANISNANQPAAPTEIERREWERYVDELRDPMAEVFCFDAER